MTQKIFDIIPPHLVSNIKEMVGIEPKHRKGKKEEKKRKTKTNSRSRGILLSLGVVILVVVIYLYFSLASVSVAIWPKTEELSFNDRVLAADGLTEVDFVNKQIPAQFITEEKELFQEFPATGSGTQSGKATGIITVYNKVSPAKSKSLIVGTRFISSSGKYFKAVSKITIPAAKTVSGKLVPGSVDVEVVAMEAGEEYNIGPDKFSVPGLAGTSSYYTIYGESKGKMTGGFKSTNKVVTDDDIQGAKDTLLDKVSGDIKTALEAKAKADGLVLLDNALTKEVEEESASVKSGSEVDSFTYKVKIKTTALVFKESDIKEFAKNYITSNLTDGYNLLEKSLAVKYNTTAVDTKNGKINMDVDLSGNQYFSVNPNTLSLILPGKTTDQMTEAISNAYSQKVSQIKVNLWPFWVKTAPKNQNKIKIELNFE